MDVVFYPLILSKVKYAMCAYGGYLTVTQKTHLLPYYVECTDTVSLVR